MNSRLIANLLRPPRRLPPPDPNCLQFDYVQLVEMFRNHERSKQQSKQLHNQTTRQYKTAQEAP